MTDLGSFVQSQVHSLKRRRGATPDPAHCLRVRRVSRHGIATHAGVSAGDLLVSVSGRQAAALGADFMKREADKRRFVFHLAKSQEDVLVETTGIDVGAQLQPTGQAIVATFDPAVADPDTLAVLWEAGEWALLERLASAALDRSRSVVDRVLGRHPPQNTPIYALRGAALYELGRHAEGSSILLDYDQSFARYWTQNWMGLVQHYLGLQAMRAGDKGEALRLSQQAFELYPCERIAGMVESLGGSRPVRATPWLGREFPAYDLPALEGVPGNVSLRATLSRLRPEQVLVVCLLATYRGNGPYNDFMRFYVSQAPWFRERWPQLHVISMETEKRADRARWFEAEARARERKLPFVVLHEDGSLCAAIEPPGSPWLFVLDQQGRVVHEGELEGCELWDALASVPA